MSAAKRPAPLTSGGSSSRSTDCPIHWLVATVMHPARFAADLPLSGGGSALQRAARYGARKIAAIFGADDKIIERIDRGFDRRRGGFKNGARGWTAREQLLRLRNASRLVLHAADRQARLDHRPVPHTKGCERHRKRKITCTAVELVEPATGILR